MTVLWFNSLDPGLLGPGGFHQSSVSFLLLLKDLLFDVLAEAERSEAAVTPAGAETIV